MTKRVLIICGASGSGKTTVKRYLEAKQQMTPIITHTTRKKRLGEDENAYHFESQTSFFTKHYLEYVKYDNNYYGSSYEALDEAFLKSDWAVIVLDTKGALSYVEKLKEQAVVLYLRVSDQEVLKKRLLKRGDEIDLIKQRLMSKEAKRDCQIPKALEKKAFILVNDDWQQTEKKLTAWLKKFAD